MKKIVYGLVLVGLSVLTACSNGDYNANPNNPTNGSVNPVAPLTSSQYTWSGSDPVSANINGAFWKADIAYVGTPDSTGGTTILAVKGSQYLTIYLRDSWKGNTYNLGSKTSTNRIIAWTDSIGGIYQTVYSYLGNSAGLNMLRNDSAGIQGKFYAKCVSPTGSVVNLSNGYFNVSRP